MTKGILNTKKLISELEIRRKALACERDKLKDLVESYQELVEVCEAADSSLYEAISTLSELV